MDNKLIVRKLQPEAGGPAVLQLNGNITLASMFDLQRIVREDASPSLIIDMTEVPIIDSAGIGLLVNAHVSRVNTGRKFALVGLAARIKTILTVTGVYNVFSVFPTLDEAKLSLGQPANS
jgi:anti-sigma B factor antagonist